MRGTQPRRRVIGAFALLVGAAAIIPMATPSGASLAASTFEGADGNQVVNDTVTPRTDWESFLPDTSTDNLFRSTDAQSGASDDSLAGGTKDNTECPATTTGSIPNNKDDLQRFYLAHETIGQETFLYLGYVRALPGGTTASAHAVFELNQVDTKCPSTTKKNQTIESPFYVRTPDDLRIAFDDEGGSTPVISVQRWQEPCASGGAACWSPKDVLDASEAEGEFNDVTITDRLNGDESLGAQRFGETRINMTAAGLLGTSSCVGFGAAGLFTGSSGNSDSEQSKDFIAPTPINLNFCQPATINVTKRDGTSQANLAGAQLGLYNDANNNNSFDTGETLATVASGSDANPCTTTAADATCSWIVTGTGTSHYVIHEVVVPAGYQAAPDIGVDVTFTSTAQTFNFTMDDPRAPRNLKVRKVDDDTPAVGVGGAVFQLYKDDGDSVFDSGDTIQTGKTCTTASSGADLGNCTITGVDTGFSYWVVETTRPAGYSADPNASSCTISSVAKSCLLVAVPVGTGDIGPTGLTFVNPREFLVITYVCQESTSKLYQSSVNLEGGTAKSSISSVPAALAAKGVTEADLCALGGAQFNDLNARATPYDSDITISP